MIRNYVKQYEAWLDLDPDDINDEDIEVRQPSEKVLENLFDAIRNNDLNAVKNYINLSYDINAKNEQGETPLICATKIHNNYNMVNFLIKNGSLVNLKDKEEKNALFFALLNGNSRTVNLLFNKGATLPKDFSIPSNISFSYIEIPDCNCRNVKIEKNKIKLIIEDADWIVGCLDYYNHDEFNLKPDSHSQIIITCKINNNQNDIANLVKEEAEDRWLDIPGFSCGRGRFYEDTGFVLNDNKIQIHQFIKNCEITLSCWNDDVNEEDFGEFEIESVTVSGDLDVETIEYLSYLSGDLDYCDLDY